MPNKLLSLKDKPAIEGDEGKHIWTMFGEAVILEVKSDRGRMDIELLSDNFKEPVFNTTNDQPVNYWSKPVIISDDEYQELKHDNWNLKAAILQLKTIEEISTALIFLAKLVETIECKNPNLMQEIKEQSINYFKEANLLLTENKKLHAANEKLKSLVDRAKRDFLDDCYILDAKQWLTDLEEWEKQR